MLNFQLGPVSTDAGSFSRWWPEPVPMLNITVNGAERTVPDSISVEALLVLLELQPRFLAVELNRRVVPRSEHRQTLLSDGDQIEIVTLVGGG